MKGVIKFNDYKLNLIKRDVTVYQYDTEVSLSILKCRMNNTICSWDDNWKIKK